jgi:hypothetical protein
MNFKVETEESSTRKSSEMMIRPYLLAVSTKSVDGELEHNL